MSAGHVSAHLAFSVCTDLLGHLPSEQHRDLCQNSVSGYDDQFSPEMYTVKLQ